MTALIINGKTVEVETEADTPLLWVLRDHLSMTGTKYGCGIAQCGACTVHVDGQPMRSCSISAATLVGKQITTIEYLEASKVGKALQDAWVAEDVPQCGYCQSGQLMSATALLNKNKNPDDAAIDAAMAGNICRCAAYVRIRAGIKRAARSLA